jgi:hypothetical protein
LATSEELIRGGGIRVDYLGHAQQYEEVLEETRELFEVWNTLDDAQQGYYDEAFRRRKLARLRELLGPADYYAGRLPPPVPVWRFEEIDR